jgi:hypothetical protein
MKLPDELLKKKAQMKAIKQGSLDALDALKLRKKLMAEFKTKVLSGHPILFNSSNPLPLTIGIHKEIFEAYPEYSHKLIRDFLKRWVSQEKHLKKLSLSSRRYDFKQS